MTKFVNKMTIRPDELTPDMGMAMKVVARTYNIDGYACWCAYSGPSDWDDERVADYGDVIDRTTAIGLFPALNWTGWEYYNP